MLKYLDHAKTLISSAPDDGGRVVIVEKGDPLFDQLAAMDPDEHAGDEAAEALDAERAAMRVSRLQARAALMQAGLLDKVDKAVNGGLLGGGADPLIKMGWAEATEFHRSSPTIAAVAGLIGLDDAALDELFRAAALIRF